MKTIKVAGAIIINESKFLIAKRKKGEFEGLWEFPGGKLEEGESSREAIVREIQEELSVTITVKEFLTNVQYDYPSFHLDMDCFICTSNNLDISLSDHSDIQWLDFKDNFDSITWCPADVQVINSLTEYLKKEELR